MSTFFNKWLTFIDLQTLITQGDYIELPGHGYNLTSNELVIKTNVADIIDVDPSAPGFAALADNQWVTEEKLVASPPAQAPPTPPTSSVVVFQAPTYVRAIWSGATSDGTIAGFNVYIDGTFLHLQPMTAPGGIDPNNAAYISGGVNGIPTFIHGSSYYIEVETVDNLGQVSTKYGFWIETSLYTIETRVADGNVDALRCTNAEDVVLHTQEECPGGVTWQSSTNLGVTWIAIGTTPLELTIATPVVDTWYRLVVDVSCATDWNGDGILETVIGTYGINVKTC